MTINKLFGSVFRNIKVVISWGAGFKGAWLALWLIEMVAQVIGVAIGEPTLPVLLHREGFENWI